MGGRALGLMLGVINRTLRFAHPTSNPRITGAGIQRSECCRVIRSAVHTTFRRGLTIPVVPSGFNPDKVLPTRSGKNATRYKMLRALKSFILLFRLPLVLTESLRPHCRISSRPFAQRFGHQRSPCGTHWQLPGAVQDPLRFQDRVRRSFTSCRQSGSKAISTELKPKPSIE